MQQVAFGTCARHGPPLDSAFNDWLAAIPQLTCEYRARQGIDGPLSIDSDTNPRSAPAGADRIRRPRRQRRRCTRLAERACLPRRCPGKIISWNKASSSAPGPTVDSIFITPAHDPPCDDGVKYKPPHGGPTDTDATGWFATKANELLAERSANRNLAGAIDIDAIRRARVRICADPLGATAMHYRAAIRNRSDLDLTVLHETVNPRWAFMTLDLGREDPDGPIVSAGHRLARRAIRRRVTRDHHRQRRRGAHGIVTRAAA